MLSFFAEKNNIIFNSRKDSIIKFGGNIDRNEELIYSHFLLLIDKVRHIVNIIDKDCNEVTDCGFKYYV